MAHPPPPWQLRGRALLVPVPIRADAARAAGVPPAARLLVAGRRTLGGLLLADYDETATLRYHELIVFSGLAAVGGRPAFVVSHIYVDSEASLEGGRAIWGLPKELATFSAAGGRVEIRRDDGVRLAVLQPRLRARRARIPLWGPIVGTLGGRAARTSALGGLRGSPGRVHVTVPAESPFAGLGLAGRRVAVGGGELALPFPPPHPPNAGAMRRSAIDPFVFDGLMLG